MSSEKTLKEGLQKLGVPKIKNLKVVRPGDASIVPVNDKLTWAQAYLTFETEKTRGQGLLRLKQNSDGAFPQAYTFFTVRLRDWHIGHDAL